MLLISSTTIVNVIISSFIITLITMNEIKKELCVSQLSSDIFFIAFTIISMATMSLVVFAKTIRYTILLFV